MRMTITSPLELSAVSNQGAFNVSRISDRSALMLLDISWCVSEEECVEEDDEEAEEDEEDEEEEDAETDENDELR